MPREPVQRRPMTQLERARATALLFVSDHTFIKFLAERATRPTADITEREATALERFCRLFRAQLTARGDGKLVPEEPPTATEGIMADVNAARPIPGDGCTGTTSCPGWRAIHACTLGWPEIESDAIDNLCGALGRVAEELTEDLGKVTCADCLRAIAEWGLLQGQILCGVAFALGQGWPVRRDPDRHIGPRPPDDGREWEVRCARCGSDTDTIDCDRCGGAGSTEPGELHEEDPLWYDEDDVVDCHQCGGQGSWPVCGSPEEFCKGNAQPGRESTEPGTLEWFVVRRPEAPA